jgi:uncharacterized glyoxalase superfamily protein PhnB
MTQFNSIMPVLKVTDMSKAIDWYTDVLGFTLCWRAPGDGDGENCMLQAGTCGLMLSTGSHLGGAPALTGTLYFDVNGVEPFFERVKDRCELVWPLETQEYGTREFGVRDPDGYVLAFAQQITPDHED